MGSASGGWADLPVMVLAFCKIQDEGFTDHHILYKLSV
jgi:hypothetical protein